MTDRFVLVPAAYVLFVRPGADGSDEVLLQLRSGTGFMDGHWAAAAAGHVEAGESVFEAARREAAEEVGVTDVTLEPLCAMHRRHSDAPVDQRVDYFLIARAWSGRPRLLEADKATDLGWFPLHDLPTPVVPHERAVLDALAAGPVPPILTFGF
jgi:8-oxo-dGTP pyrophosphatase MutT (NUDIX family)